MGWGRYGFEYREYVPVARKKAMAVAAAKKLAEKEKRKPAPVVIEGRKITKTFWGQAWCDNLEAYSDFANRLPRGATYVRNGSVADLVIQAKKIKAIVGGSEVYTVTIEIDSLSKKAWTQLKQDCSSSIDSLFDLLSGKFSDGVMQRLTRKADGLFPSPKEIKLDCSCPDYSDCCKHIAAVMYGVGARLDKQPELLFLLRDVDHQELVTEAVSDGNLEQELSSGANTLDGADLGAMFGIELVPVASASKKKPAAKKPVAGRKKTATAKAVPAKPVAVKVDAAKMTRVKTVAGKPKATRATLAVKKKKVPTRVASVKTAAAAALVAMKTAAKKTVTKSPAKTAVKKKLTTKAARKVEAKLPK